ncbi:hypothetical protein [Isoalcanivorax indicus]|uniref:hypothetical protein n=1 Tax=Isoalcanivorax indicus TaxID=2202653 RepID=UPI000DBA31B9|nr:hypothetical protein [Isoalcanivorax indicus]
MSGPVAFLDSEGVRHLGLARLTLLSRYRGLALLCPQDHEQLFRHELAAALEAGGVCATLGAGQELAAVCAVMPLAWDSAHFGMPMANLLVAAAPDCTRERLSALLNAALSRAAAMQPLRHVSVELDIDDYNGLNALLAMGCEVVDIKRYFRWSSLKGVRKPKFLSRVRAYAPTDHARVMQLLEAARFESRFSRDALLREQDVRTLYTCWFEQLLARADDDVMALVFEKAGRVQACGVIAERDLRPAGVPVQFMDQGLYVSGPQGVGGYYPVIYALAERALARYDTVQTCVSLNNYPAVRVLERMSAGTPATRYALRMTWDRPQVEMTRVRAVCP